MSCGSLPPVPGLIPIAALRKSPSCNNNDLRECTPCAVQKEVMGEQRSRRTGSQPSVDLIDNARRSRAAVGTPQAPSGKARAERHRKSERRRERRGGRKRSASKRREEEKCVNPRVNPIFVWVRQEDTHIVDVKCEDYDKRNRIVLTKTAQGWRAIPRTETLVPNLKAAAHKHQHPRKMRKSNKIKRKSTAVQVDDDDDDVLLIEDHDQEPPSWNAPVNVESHLPSHKIQVQKRNCSPEPEAEAATTTEEPIENVNSAEEFVAAAAAALATRSPLIECSANKICDVSPLDNLLAVAELEFNQQIQTEAWNDAADLKSDEPSLPIPDDGIQAGTLSNFDSEGEKDDNCDYDEEEENNLMMDALLSRLEQSLQSPDALCTEDEKRDANVPDNLLSSFPEKEESKTEIKDEGPTDLTTKKVECLTIAVPEDLMPTDLTVPKKKARSPSPKMLVSPRPSSRSSETIQSPQPSGLPAVPHSPDIPTSKSVYLESLLSSSSAPQKPAKEPIDFGKCRKSASPTVTCSEEVDACSSSTGYKDGEPEPKKGRLDDITLRTILDANNQGKEQGAKASETSRLLELLTSEAEPDALTQLKQLYADLSVNLPDPMLIPKDKLSQILMSPGKEIPRLLSQRPELRLPEALAFPHLLQDPDILVITLAQLETIIRKQAIGVPAEKIKAPAKKIEFPDKIKPQKVAAAAAAAAAAAQQPQQSLPPPPHPPKTNDFGDLNLTNNPLNQMMWLPYLHQLEMAAMAFGNGADFLKMLSSALPPSYSNQMPDVSQLFPLNRFPQPTSSFPMQPPLQTNPFDFPLWHDNPAPRAASNHYERHPARNAFLEKAQNKNSNHKYGTSNKNATATASNNFPNNYYHPQHGMQPFVNVPTTYANLRPSIQVPQYTTTSSLAQKKNCDQKIANFYRTHHQRLSYNQKLGALVNNHKGGKQHALGHLEKKQSAELTTQPIDLSGSTTTTTSATKHGLPKTNYCDSVGLAKSLKFDDIPEVGSTTTTFEEMTAHMQESQKHLWHPLFGNQKSSSNPWNWSSTVTATGE